MTDLHRGDVWTTERLGRTRNVLLIGHDAITRERPGALCVPISDVVTPKIFQPAVHDMDGTSLGAVLIPDLGEINKERFKGLVGSLAPHSMEARIALRAALDL